MDYYANIDAVSWFYRDIFPTIKRETPTVQFFIVGGNPHPQVKDLSSNGAVRVTGYVKDVRPYYKAADVCVIPLRLARGVQNKVLEAMAMGKAVVATTKAVGGIEAIPEEHLLVADTCEDFAIAISRLLKNEVFRERVGASARKFVAANYVWQAHMKDLEGLFCGDV
jgi:glycosyltransferase involved in cell wall biosynthesis